MCVCEFVCGYLKDTTPHAKDRADTDEAGPLLRLTDEKDDIEELCILKTRWFGI